MKRAYRYLVELTTELVGLAVAIALGMAAIVLFFVVLNFLASALSGDSGDDETCIGGTGVCF